MKYFDGLNELFSLSKTIKFKLLPQFNTDKFVKQSGFLEQDKQLLVEFKKMKDTINEYHKCYIQKSLTDFSFDSNLLLELQQELNKNNKDNIKLSCDKLRSILSRHFTTSSDYKVMFSSELIKSNIKEFATNNNLYYTDVFDNKTTYFTGFNEIRELLYSSDLKKGTIPYRIINDNLTTFINNINTINNIKSNITFYTNMVDKMKFDGFLDIESIGDIEFYNTIISNYDKYNILISGYTKDTSTKVKGINEYINEYNQTAPKDLKIKKLNKLKKIPLFDGGEFSFKFDVFETDLDVVSAVKYFHDTHVKNILDVVKDISTNLTTYDTSKIILVHDTRSMSTWSNILFNDFSFIKRLLSDKFIKDNNISNINKRQQTKLNSYIDNSILSIHDLLDLLIESEYTNYNSTFILDKIKNEFSIEVNNKKFDLVTNINEKYYPISGLFEYDDITKLNNEQRNSIKSYLDSVMLLYKYIKNISIPQLNINIDSDFYNSIEIVSENIDGVIKLYNMTRNHFTKKPYSLKKFKLNFDNSTLLSGWDVNKETDNNNFIFKDDKNFYLGIVNTNNAKIKDVKTILNKAYESNEIKKPLQKVIYKKFDVVKGMGKKTFPKTFDMPAEYLKHSGIDIHQYKHYIKKIDHSDLTMTDDIKNIIIDYYKFILLHAKSDLSSYFDLSFKDSSCYKTPNEFLFDIEDKFYSLNYNTICFGKVEEMVNEGELFLFKLYNKDFSEYSKGRENLHTMYWRKIFENTDIFELNGGATMYYREKSLTDDIVVHKKGELLYNKNPNCKKEKIAKYDITKDKRFTTDSYHLHVPITINRKSVGASKFYKMNDIILDRVKNNKNVNIIGIDRGERNLLYAYVINQNGDILEKVCLNKITNTYKDIEITTDYHKLLSSREKERVENKRGWNAISLIKELKDGYMSNVVNIISKLIIKYNAIIVLENLNGGFKQSRKSIDKEVYQKFENSLINKLEYLTIKDNGVECGYQLACRNVKSEKQNGIIFYINPYNTSAVDPMTGYVNLFKTKDLNTIPKIKNFISNIDNIVYGDDRFVFSIDYNKFTNVEGLNKTNWKLGTHGDRLVNKKDKNGIYQSNMIDITEEYIKLFNEFGIDYKSKLLLSDILCVNNKTFFERFVYLFNVFTNIRNSKSGTDIDYILSPAIDEEDKYFDSRKYNNTNIPSDADANGAYNIARKGLMLLDRLSNIDLSEKQKDDFRFIRNKDWYNYIVENKLNVTNLGLVEHEIHM